MRTVKRAIRAGVAWCFLGPSLAILFCMGIVHDALEVVADRWAPALEAVWNWGGRRG